MSIGPFLISEPLSVAPEILSAMNALCKRSASLLERVSNLALGVFVLPLGTVEGSEESGEDPSSCNVIATIAPSSLPEYLRHFQLKVVASSQACTCVPV